MSKRTIAKFGAFVIFIALPIIGAAGCSHVSSTQRPDGAEAQALSSYGKPQVVGKIASDKVIESSGIAASRCQPGVYWTHNDSGNGPYLYAVNLKGDDLGTWKVPNATNEDWEDIAEFKDSSGKCFVYVADIGDNKDRRTDHTIYRIPEPQTGSASAGKDNVTDNAEAIKFRYADTNHNAETMMVHPTTGSIYVLTKRTDGPSGVYKITSTVGSDGVFTADKIAEISVPNIPNGLLTGGDIAPDATRAVICDYSGGYELRLRPGDANFDDVWKQKPEPVDLGKLDQGEAIAYSADGNSIIATSEKKHPPIVEVKRAR
jgi:hypothetical protein